MSNKGIKTKGTRTGTEDRIARALENPFCKFCGDAFHSSRKCPSETCTVCGQKGHQVLAGDTKCRGGFEIVQNRVESSHSKVVSRCGSCGGANHTTSECYRNQTCEKCDRKGHIASMCRTERCDIHGWGHSTADCNTMKQCHLCLIKGHIARYCHSDPWCEHCREEHHPGECEVFAERGCSFCGAKDHVALTCEEETSANTPKAAAANSNVECRFCGERGHSAMDCDSPYNARNAHTQYVV